MKKIERKKMAVLLIVTLLMMISRCIITDADDSIKYMAIVNIIAIAYIFYTIIEKIVDKLESVVRSSGVPKEIQEKNIKEIQNGIWTKAVGGGAIFSGAYFIFLCSSLLNDIVSILALLISVLDDDIVEIVSEYYKG